MTQKACRIFYEKEEVIFLDWIVRYLRCHKQVALVLRDYPEIDAIPVLVACHWIEEVPGIGQAVCADRSQIGQLKVSVIHLANVAAAGTSNVNAEADTCKIKGFYQGAGFFYEHQFGTCSG